MAKLTILNSEIERSQQMIDILGDAESIAAGDIVLVGPNLLARAVEKADGLTARNVSIAAGEIPNPDRAAMLLTAELLLVPKTAGLDTIAVGTKVWWDTTTEAVITALSQVTTDTNYACGVTVELSDDVNDEVMINFDGRNTVAENGTG
jgi:hypothetical protein